MESKAVVLKKFGSEIQSTGNHSEIKKWRFMLVSICYKTLQMSNSFSKLDTTVAEKNESMMGFGQDKTIFKLCTHDQDLRIRKFCIYANFAYVSKSIFTLRSQGF